MMNLDSIDDEKQVAFWKLQIFKIRRDASLYYKNMRLLYQDYCANYPEEIKLRISALKKMAGIDWKGLEEIKGQKMILDEDQPIVGSGEYRDKTKETDNTISLTDDENKLDVKPDVDETLAKKEDDESVEKDTLKENEDIRLFKSDNKLDDPLNDENLIRKEDYEIVKKVKDDKVKFSKIEENNENSDNLKETEEFCLRLHEDKLILVTKAFMDKLNETSDDDDENKVTLGIPKFCILGNIFS